MKGTEKIPALRFRDFDGDWTTSKVADVTTYVDYRGKTPPKSESGVFLVTAKNVKVGHIDYECSKEYIPKELYDEVMRRGRPRLGDVLITTEAPLGNVATIDRIDIALAQRIIKLRGKERILSNDFLKHILLSQSFQKSLNEKSTGSTAKGIKGSVLHKLPLVFPSIAEQQKIAAFLSAVDKKIGQLAREKELLLKYKKGVMQQIFEQKIRFKDQDGNDFPDWEEKTLGELGSTYNGLVGKTADDFGEGSPYVTYKQIFDNSRIQCELFEFVKIDAKEKQNRVEFGDVFFTTSSETSGEVAFASVILDTVENLYLNSFCFGYRAHSLNEVKPQFSRYLFRSNGFRRKVFRLAQGSTRYNISKTEMMKLTIPLPNPAEQMKIAAFLSAIDEKIEHLDLQLGITRTFKKGLLQQMFV